MIELFNKNIFIYICFNMNLSKIYKKFIYNKMKKNKQPQK